MIMIKAIQEATRAIKLEPNQIDAYLVRAQSQTKLGNFDLAINDYDKINELDSNYIFSYEKRGDIYYFNLERMDDAYSEYVEASKLDPNNNYYLSKIREIDDMRRKESLYADLLVGKWVGVYGEGSGKSNLVLDIDRYQDGILHAVFTFSEHPDNLGRASGSYKMEGELSNDLDVILNGYEWINHPNGFSFLDVNAKLDITKLRLIDYDINLFLQKQITDETVVDEEYINNDSFRKPLSSIILSRLERLHGYVVNSNYATLRGTGYEMGYNALSGGVAYEETISVCSFEPFELIYNLEGKYSTLTGEVGFDDISISGTDIVGIHSNFEGEATIHFIVDDVEKESVIFKTTDFPKSFNIDIAGGKKLVISVTFPYFNFVTDNFNKYFNIINAYVE